MVNQDEVKGAAHRNIKLVYVFDLPTPKSSIVFQCCPATLLKQ
jgi:hypothetical protein